MPAESAPEPSYRPSGPSAQPAVDAHACAQKYPDLYQAAVNGPVSFGQLVQAQRLARSDDRVAAAAGDWLIPQLTARFGDLHGGVDKQYYCRIVTGGCLLAKDRTVYSILNSPPVELVDVEVECKVAARKARYGLPGKGLADMLEEATDHAYSGLTRIMVAADTAADPDRTAEDKAAAVAAAKSEVAAMTGRVGALLQRQARLEYFQGVLLATVPTLVLVALFGLAASAWWRSALTPSAFVAATCMSVLGATVSVIQRMSTGGLVIDDTAPRWQRIMLGGLRPGLGAVFGALAYFTVLAATTAAGGPEATAVFAVSGFAAGFSERFATDMLERAGSLLGPSTTPKDGS
ncbi:MAG TPA: hypothetical protein VGJ44_15290 [Kribbellaceae bacterium]|jgi:hypothetical protein